MYFHLGWLLCIINGISDTVIGYKRELTNQTAKKIFNKEAPTNMDSAITKEPGKAYVKKVENILSCIVNPKFFNKAPIATKLAPSAMAGLSGLLMHKTL